MPKVRWVSFVANFIRFPAVQKFWESVKIWQVADSSKVGTFWDTLYISAQLQPVTNRKINITTLNVAYSEMVRRQWIIPGVDKSKFCDTAKFYEHLTTRFCTIIGLLQTGYYSSQCEQVTYRMCTPQQPVAACN